MPVDFLTDEQHQSYAKYPGLELKTIGLAAI
jgi:hypothetical protein